MATYKAGRNRNKQWTKEEARQVFELCDSISEVVEKAGNGCYRFVWRGGWITEFCRHMSKKPSSYEYSDQELLDFAKGAKSHTDLKARSSVVYRHMDERGLLDEILAPKFTRWTLEKCKEVAAKYTKRGQWQKHDNNSYAAAQRKGWLEECCAHMEPPPDYLKGRAKQGTWTYDKCVDSARQYISRAEWLKGDRKAYFAAYNRGWMDEIVERFEWSTTSRLPSGYWQDPLRCILDARQYSTRGEWDRESKVAYKTAKENGWFEACVAHMAPVTAKPRGYWEDESNWHELIESAQQYSNRQEWQEGDSAAYAQAYKINGQLWKDCTAHMERYSGAKADAIYVWRPTSMTDEVLSVMPGFHLVKIGATSTCQGDSRVSNCANNNGMEYELIGLCETSERDAHTFERWMLDMGVRPEMPYWYDGKTEFRLISDEELDLIKQLMGVQEDALEQAA